MFGRSMFGDDPFFSSSSNMFEEFNRMDQMMSSFGMPGGRMGQPPHHSAIGDSSNRQQRNHQRRSHQQQHQQQQHQNEMLSPIGRGGMFGGGSVFQEMNRMMADMERGSSSSTGQFYSSSKVMSYSRGGEGDHPKYYEASSQITQGPDGVRQTRKSERNSETGTDRMAIGHHIHDRGHVVERIRNNQTNEREEKQNFINLDEDDRERFHQEWQSKAGRNHQARGLTHHDSSHNRYQPHQPRALDSAEYHRNNLTRHRSDSRQPTERRRQRDNDRHVRYEEI